MKRALFLLVLLLASCSYLQADDVSLPPKLNGRTCPECTPTPTEEGLIEQAVQAYATQNPNLVLDAPYLAGMSGSVDELGGVHETVFPGDNARDSADFEGFVSWDISVIDSNDTIIDAQMSFGTCVTYNFPFSDPPFGLGPLSVDYSQYGELDVGDYLGSEGDYLLFDLRECPTEPIDVTTAIKTHAQADVFQLRLYFSGSNGDGYRDDVTFLDPQLVIQYHEGNE